MRRAWSRPSWPLVLWCCAWALLGCVAVLGLGCGPAEAQDVPAPPGLDPAVAAYLQQLSAQQPSSVAPADLVNWVLGGVGGGGALYFLRSLLRDLIGDLAKGGLAVTVSLSAEDRRLMTEALDGQRERGQRQAEIETLQGELEKIRDWKHERGNEQQRTDMRLDALEGTGWAAGSTPAGSVPRKRT